MSFNIKTIALFGLLLLAACSQSIHDTVAVGDLVGLEEMLNEDPELIASRTDLGKTALHYAVTAGQPEALGLLLEHGADIEAADKTGMRPLHVAAALDRIEEAALLLDAGAKLDAPDHFGDTPLHAAAMHGATAAIAMLLRNGAAWDTPNNGGLTPAALARKNRRTGIAKQLEAFAEHQSGL